MSPLRDGNANDLAGEAFWNGFWRRPAGRRFGRASFSHWVFARLLRQYARAGDRACEIGCGASIWLPELAARGVDAWGIDYSPVGVDLAREHARRANVSVTVVQGDVFDAAALAGQQFDLVFSLGLLEHFADSRALVSRFTDLCRPGGRVITLVPNFAGLWGRVQRAVDADVYDVHRIYVPALLDRAHEDAGLEPIERAHYFGGIGPLVVNYARLFGRMPSAAAKLTFGAMWAAQQLVCWTTQPLPEAIRNPPSLAAHIVGVYRRPELRGS